jgi:hypothetical protein
MKQGSFPEERRLAVRTKKRDKPFVEIRNYLSRYKSISVTRAASHFGVYNLPRQIFRLKQDGLKFTKKGKGKDLTYTVIEPEVKNDSG